MKEHYPSFSIKPVSHSYQKEQKKGKLQAITPDEHRLKDAQ